MEYLYINGNSQVGIEKEADLVTRVFIDGCEQIFTPEDTQNKLEFALKAKRNKYRTFLNNQFENLTILTGAGASKDAGGKLLAELWDEAVALLTGPKLNMLCELVRYNDKCQDGSYVKNLEKLLSLANAASVYVKNGDLDISECVLKIQAMIKLQCEIPLPEDSIHELFLEKIAKRKLTHPRAKIFTLNYDTLFEQAGRKRNFTIIDGFSFSFPRIFSGRNFDHDIVHRSKSRVKEEDNFIRKVFHLYKPHGSVDWAKHADGTVRQAEKVKSPLMIFPNDNKYENSYDQPFFEMMSRFHQNLRKENVLLICIGFSFNDKHIVTAIKEALEQNSSFQIMVVNKGIDESNNLAWLFRLSKSHSNIVLIDETFSDFAINYPDMKLYNQEEHKKIIILSKDDERE